MSTQHRTLNGCSRLRRIGSRRFFGRDKMNRLVSALGFEVHDQNDITAQHKRWENGHLPERAKLARGVRGPQRLLAGLVGDCRGLYRIDSSIVAKQIRLPDGY